MQWVEYHRDFDKVKKDLNEKEIMLEEKNREILHLKMNQDAM